MKTYVMSLAAVLVSSSWLWGAEAPVPKFTPGQSIRYWVQEIQDITGTGGSSTSKTYIARTYELTAVVGQSAADGKVPVTLKVTRFQISTPHWVGFNLSQEQFDTKTWNGTAPPSENIMVPGIAMQRSPLQLLFDARGHVTGLGGGDAMRKEMDSLLQKYFGSHPAYRNTVMAYRTEYGDAAFQMIWQNMLVQELPSDFDIDEEWQVKRPLMAGNNRVSLGETNTAKDAGSGAIEIKTNVKLPRTEPITIKKHSSDTIYYVKNGTGSGITIVDPDGWIRKSDTTLHIYISSTNKSPGAEFPMEFYNKLRRQAIRLDAAK